MSKAPVNIYSAVVFDLNKRIKAYIDDLNSSNQIDLDDSGYPYLLSVDKNGPNFVVNIVRNGQRENFIINTRKRKDPVTSWDENDGYRRSGGKKVVMVTTKQDAPKRERRKRTIESFSRITEQILGE